MSADTPVSMPARWRGLWLFVGLPIAAGMMLAVAWHAWPPAHPYRDLTQDWLSARCFFDGRSIYTRHDESARRYLQRAPKGEEWNVKINAHPPVCVLALLPTGLLSHQQAVLIWNLLSLLMLVAAVWLALGPYGLNCDRWYWLAAGCLLACSTPLAAQAATAQLNPLLVLLIVAAWASDRNEKSSWAGGLVGLAASIKLFPAFLLVYFFFTGRRKAIATALATIVVVHLAAAFLFGLGDMIYYARHVVPEVDAWRSAWLNCSLAGFWSRLFDVTDVGTREWFHAPLLARALTYLTSAALTVAVAWRSWNANNRQQRDLAFAAAIVAMLLASPVTWDHSLLVLVLPICVAWYYTRTAQKSQAALIAFLLLPGFVPACRLWETFLEPASLPVMNRLADPLRALTVLAITTYCLLGLFTVILWRLWPASARTEAKLIESESFRAGEALTPAAY
jgi:hypothetical protein